MKINIVYIINQLRRSGPVNVLYDIIANLDYNRFNPIVIKLMADDPDKSYTYKFQELGIEIIERNLSFWDLEMRTKHIAKEIDLLVSERNIDIINTHGYHPLLISSYMKVPIPRIDTVHCISINSFRSSRGWLIGTYMHLRYLYRLRKIECRVGISETVTKYYDSILRNNKSCTIYNGINTCRFNLNEKTRINLKRSLGLDIYNKVFVVVGHLSPLKDPLTVLKAYIDLIDKGKLKDSCLIFCGHGTLYEKCKFLATNYHMIKFTGYINNVHEYLQVADYSICASHSEGFGLNYIEAIMCGCVVISSKIPAFNEFTDRYFELKQLQFEPSDKNHLAQVITDAISNDIDMTSIRKDAINRFSAQRMSIGYMDLFETYINKN